MNVQFDTTLLAPLAGAMPWFNDVQYIFQEELDYSNEQLERLRAALQKVSSADVGFDF